MITLRDTIEIQTSPEKIFQWFTHLDRNFRSWHPKVYVPSNIETNGGDNRSAEPDDRCGIALFGSTNTPRTASSTYIFIRCGADGNRHS